MNAGDQGIIFLPDARPPPFYLYNYIENIDTSVTQTWMGRSFTGKGTPGRVPDGKCGCGVCANTPCNLATSGPISQAVTVLDNGAFNPGLEGGDAVVSVLHVWRRACTFKSPPCANNLTIPASACVCTALRSLWRHLWQCSDGQRRGEFLACHRSDTPSTPTTNAGCKLTCTNTLLLQTCAVAVSSYEAFTAGDYACTSRCSNFWSGISRTAPLTNLWSSIMVRTGGP